MSSEKKVLLEKRFNEYGYGPYDYLFGRFPEEAVSTDGKGGYSVDENMLEEGDFVAFRTSMYSSGMLDGDGEPKIIAHRLPIGEEIPQSWEYVGGQLAWRQNGYGEKTSWKIIRTSDGAKMSFEEAAEELGLITMFHPYGQIWLEENGHPVASSTTPYFSVAKDRVVELEALRGDRGFFHKKGLAILQTEDRDTYYHAGTFYQCSRKVKIRGFSLDNLRPDGWYPVAVKEHFVVWGTGVHLFPKHLEWNLGTEGPREDELGTLLFDSSCKRMEKVREFFRTAVGVRVSRPMDEYIRWANHEDPRGGEWRTSHQYPQTWEPHFSGKLLEEFQGVECRWQQPESGPAHYYGVVR